MTDTNDFSLDRNTAVPALLGNHKDFLIVAGLAGAAKDVANLTDDGEHSFMLGGAMGGAVSMGLGLALAQPNRKVLVVTGDGELLMNVGSLATVAALNPPNLSIVVVDNGHYGETGYQASHTSLGVDLEKMAQGAGIKATRTIKTADQIADGAALIRESNGASFVLLRVSSAEPPQYNRSWDGAYKRMQFRKGLLGKI
jgi:thiamine pyrophosphate-dependent acetolactate synthase large subunit-like protein